MLLYLIGTLAYLSNIQAALALLDGMPRRVSWRPGTSDTYFPGARGWVDQVCQSPIEVPATPGEGFIRFPESIQSHLSTPEVTKSIEVNGELVTIPQASDLFERSELSQVIQDYLTELEAV